MDSKKAFSLIEISLVVSIIGIIFSFALPNFYRSWYETVRVSCISNRKVIENAELVFYQQNNRHSESLQELVDSGYLEYIPKCPAGGVYSWLPFPKNDWRYQRYLVCSIHGSQYPIMNEDSYQEDFDDGDAKGWTQTAGKKEDIQVKDKKLYIGNPKKISLEDKVFFGDQAWKDYTISLKAKLLKGKLWYGYGIYFRSQDFKKTNAYIFQYDPGFFYILFKDGRLKIGKGAFLYRKVINGRQEFPFAIEPAPPGFKWKNVERQIKIEVKKDTFTTYIDNKKVLEAKDRQFKQGAIGLRTWWGSRAVFDNIKIKLHK